LLLIGGISVTLAAFAQNTDLTFGLVDARLEILRNSGVAGTDEIIQAYEIAQTRLNDAASFNLSDRSVLATLSQSVTMSAK
jgi:hypothetical protein